jgi:hypothetical protein
MNFIKFPRRLLLVLILAATAGLLPRAFAEDILKQQALKFMPESAVGLLCINENPLLKSDESSRLRLAYSFGVHLPKEYERVLSFIPNYGNPDPTGRELLILVKTKNPLVLEDFGKEMLEGMPGEKLSEDLMAYRAEGLEFGIRRLDAKTVVLGNLKSIQAPRERAMNTDLAKLIEETDLQNSISLICYPSALGHVLPELLTHSTTLVAQLDCKEMTSLTVTLKYGDPKNAKEPTEEELIKELTNQGVTVEEARIFLKDIIQKGLLPRVKTAIETKRAIDSEITKLSLSKEQATALVEKEARAQATKQERDVASKTPGMDEAEIQKQIDETTAALTNYRVKKMIGEPLSPLLAFGKKLMKTAKSEVQGDQYVLSMQTPTKLILEAQAAEREDEAKRLKERQLLDQELKNEFEND